MKKSVKQQNYLKKYETAKYELYASKIHIISGV